MDELGYFFFFFGLFLFLISYIEERVCEADVPCPIQKEGLSQHHGAVSLVTPV